MNEELLGMLDQLAESESLTDWEANFIDEMQQKRRRYAADVRFSERQETKIRQIHKDRIRG